LASDARKVPGGVEDSARESTREWRDPRRDGLMKQQEEKLSINEW